MTYFFVSVCVKSLREGNLRWRRFLLGFGLGLRHGWFCCCYAALYVYICAVYLAANSSLAFFNVASG